MYKENLKPTIELGDYTLTITKGGTEHMTVPDVAKRFNYVRASLLGQPSGYVQLSDQARIPQSVLPELLPLAYSICIGPTNTALPGVVNTYQITNYNSFYSYTTKTDLGKVVISKDTISYTPFNYSGNAGFYVNDEWFTIIVGNGGPVQPTIITPTHNAVSIGSTLIIRSTSFTSTNPQDTHEVTQWQVSLDPTFAVPSIDTAFQPTNKLSFEAKPLKSNRTYYIRVRYRGTMGAVSPWSHTVIFTTSERFVASQEQAKFMVPKAPIVVAPTDPDAVIEVDDYFGYAVAISQDGNTAIVGAPQDDTLGKNTGAAYIFTRTGVSWTRQAKLLAYDPIPNAHFGAGVAISTNGNIAVIGARGAEEVAGSVYEFKRTGDLWVQQAKMEASDTAAYDYFGGTLSISQDASTMVVGARYASSRKGKAYVYNRVGPIWTEIAILSSIDSRTDDLYGSSVAISADGTFILVGTPYADDVYQDAGCVYVYYRSGLNWIHQYTIRPTDRHNGDMFGISVSLSSNGTTAVVGAYGDSTDGEIHGSAYVFTRTSTTWTQHTKLTSTDLTEHDYFGNAVCISPNGTEILVGAYNKDAGTGAGYVFIKVNDKWLQQSKLVAGDGMAGDWFGYSVSLSTYGTTAILGAYRNDKVADDSGAAYVFA